jgi:hypothetical protein
MRAFSFVTRAFLSAPASTWQRTHRHPTRVVDAWAAGRAAALNARYVRPRTDNPGTLAQTRFSGGLLELRFIVISRDRRMNSSVQHARDSRRRLRIALPVLVLLATAACASTPIPESNMQAARQAIANAERVDAASLAAVELGEARTRLSAAQQAVSEKKMLKAERLADQSRAAAELAAARTGAAKANAVNADIEKSTATLIDEMQRSSGATK